MVVHSMAVDTYQDEIVEFGAPADFPVPDVGACTCGVRSDASSGVWFELTAVFNFQRPTTRSRVHRWRRTVQPQPQPFSG